MNKGLEIWSKKRSKRKKQAMTKKPKQIGVVRFVEFTDIVHQKVNGKFVHPLTVKRFGLQIENRFYYLAEGIIAYSMINKHGAKINKTYEGIPDWAEEKLVQKYNAYREKFLTSIQDNNEE